MVEVSSSIGLVQSTTPSSHVDDGMVRLMVRSGAQQFILSNITSDGKVDHPLTIRIFQENTCPIGLTLQEVEWSRSAELSLSRSIRRETELQ
jgi:hypothetical protein